MKYLTKLLLCLGMLGLIGTAQAGHLFTQASSNTPIALSAGQGIDIPQLSFEGGTFSTGTTNIYMAGWDTGDIMKIVLGTYTQTFSFDSLIPGQSQNSSGLFGIDPALTAAAMDLTAPITWRFEALAGAFTLNGYRIYTGNETVDGTGAGVVNQVNVTPNNPVPEPSILLLMAVGLLGLGFIRKEARS